MIGEFLGDAARPISPDVERRVRDCGLIGTERVFSTPCAEVHRVDRGVLLALGTDPKSWNTEEHKLVEARAREHLGQQYFFSKDNPDRQTVSPNFGLSG